MFCAQLTISVSWNVHITGQCFISKRWRITCARFVIWFLFILCFFFHTDCHPFYWKRFGLHSIFHLWRWLCACATAINAFMAHTHSQGSAQCSTQLFFGDFRRCGTQFFAKLNLNSSPFFVLLSLMLTWWLFIGVSFWRIIFRGPRIVFNAWIKRQSSSTHSFSFMGIIHHYIGELGELMFANVCTIVLCYVVSNSWLTIRWVYRWQE